VSMAECSSGFGIDGVFKNMGSTVNASLAGGVHFALGAPFRWYLFFHQFHYEETFSLHSLLRFWQHILYYLYSVFCTLKRFILLHHNPQCSKLLSDNEVTFTLPPQRSPKPQPTNLARLDSGGVTTTLQHLLSSALSLLSQPSRSSLDPEPPDQEPTTTSSQTARLSPNLYSPKAYFPRLGYRHA
jgi:hypothetical protein